MAKGILVLALVSILLIPRMLFAEPLVVDLTSHTPRNAALRSVVLPGWGQFFNKQDTKGYIIGPTAFLSALSSFILYSKANKTYEDYETLGLKNSSLYSDYETQNNQALAAVVVLAGTWAYAVIDAYIASKNLGFSEEDDNEGIGDESFLTDDGLKLAFNADRFGLIFNKKF